MSGDVHKNHPAEVILQALHMNENTAKKVEVTIAGLEKDFVLVSSGLENYKSLIVSGSAYLNDNSSIRIVE